VLVKQNGLPPMHPGWLSEKSERLVTILLRKIVARPCIQGFAVCRAGASFFQGARPRSPGPIFDQRAMNLRKPMLQFTIFSKL
jgi:hypothetical protein